MHFPVYRIFRRKLKPQPGRSRPTEPELLTNWPAEVECEDRRRRNRVILDRMAAREDRERRSALGFWRFWWRRLADYRRRSGQTGALEQKRR